MTEPPAPDRAPADAAWSPAWGVLAVAAGVGLGVLAWSWEGPAPAADSAKVATPAPLPAMPPIAQAPVPAAPAPAAAAPVAAAPALPAAASGPVRNRDPNGDQTPDLSDYVNPGEQPTMDQVIRRLNQAGVHTGLGAFTPPGTRPPLIGLAVPEDYVLPDGYVRHYQATDDGQRIEPILMFAPDRQFFDAAGQPVAIPKDRVVPPEWAPPGFPVRRVAIPAPRDTAKPGS